MLISNVAMDDNRQEVPGEQNKGPWRAMEERIPRRKQKQGQSKEQLKLL